MEKREVKFKTWTGSIMMQPRSILTLHQEAVNGLTVGQWEKQIYLQYTGLKDKNGKDIYGGDICKMRVEKDFINYEGDDDSVYKDLIGLVVIIASKGVCLRNPNYECLNTGDKGIQKGYYNVASYRTEIIGNIYENPELLTP